MSKSKKTASSKIPKPLNDLIQRASDFVNENRGRWSNKQWQDFIAKNKKSGIEITDELQSYLKELVEAMKEFYHATRSTDGVSKALKSAASDTAKFVSEHKGRWTKAERKEFSNRFKSGRESLSEEAKTYLGGILDAAKDIYPASAKKAKAKKAVTKTKAKAKKAVKKASKKASAKKSAVKKKVKKAAKKSPAKKAKKKKAVKKKAASK